METLLGVPVEIILVASLGATLVAVLALTALTLRRPLLARVAARNAARRRAQAILITLGLALSTIITSTAFNTGDTITHTVRSLVASGLGRADEVVLAIPRDRRRSPGEYLAALVDGSLLTGLGSYFPETRATQLAAATAGDPRIGGLLPAIAEQVTVVNLDLQAVQGQVNLVAIPPDYPSAFGPLRTAEGAELRLDVLGPNELLAGAEAAAQTGATPGTHLELRTPNGALQYVVRDVVSAGGLGGTRPTLYLPLSAYQHAVGRQGQVNQVLVANAGDATTSYRLSADVARTLRVGLADRSAVEAVFALLRREAVRAQFAEAARTAEGREREKLEALVRSLDRAGPSDEFISLATDPQLERRLLQAAGRAGLVGAGFGAVPEISPLRVLEVKQASQEQADRWGGALTSVFLIMGLFSLASGTLLVFLIFSTLAAERRAELGITRALGGRRRDVIAGFLLEGAVYAAPASALGLLIGVLVALAIVQVANTTLEQHGVRVEPRLEPRSLVIAYCLGLLLTFLSIGYSAWRISRLTIVTAIRNLPEPPSPPHGWRARVLPPSLALGGALLVAVGAPRQWALAQALGAAFGLIGLALLGRGLLTRLRLGSAWCDRLAYSTAGLGLLLYWLAPANLNLPFGLRPIPRGVDLFFLAGLSVVLGAAWVAVYNLGLLTGPLVRFAAGLRSTGLALRTATANPLQHRFRTGMIVAMFSLVIFSMAVAGVLLTATHRAYSDPEALSGGFDVRVDLTQPDDSPRWPQTLDQASAVRPDDFVEVGRLARRPGQVVEPAAGVSRWRAYGLHEIDAGFASGLRSPLAARATDFASDAEAWAAVLEQPGYAVVGGSAVGPRNRPATFAAGFRFADLYQGDERFSPRELWIRDDRGGAAVRLVVVGVLDPRVSFPEGLYTSATTFRAARAPAPQRVSYYLKARPDAEPPALALGLNISFAERGVRASAIGEEVRQIQSLRELLNQLLQGFFAVGLLAGLAALGVVSMRAVVERRQQVGVLRALGFRRSTVRLSLLIEISLIALLGIGLGTLLGLALARRLVEHLGQQYPEIVFGVPWGQLLLVALGAYLAALLLAALPLWRIGRIEPAEALRYE